MYAVAPPLSIEKVLGVQTAGKIRVARVCRRQGNG